LGGRRATNARDTCQFTARLCRNTCFSFWVFPYLAGLEIVNIEKIIVARGPKTWGFGVFLTALGIALAGGQQSNDIVKPEFGPASYDNRVGIQRGPNKVQLGLGLGRFRR
jgi:hypothetical protein